ncbi:unnamed protein product, partial [Prorocentrum cordatum]
LPTSSDPWVRWEQHSSRRDGFAARGGRADTQSTFNAFLPHDPTYFVRPTGTMGAAQLPPRWLRCARGASLLRGGEGAAPPAAQGAAGRGLPRAQTLPVAAGAGGTGGREERVSPARGAQEGTTEEADGGGLTGIIEGIDGKVDIGLRRVDNSIGELWEKIERVATSLDTLKNQLRNI